MLAIGLIFIQKMVVKEPFCVKVNEWFDKESVTFKNFLCWTYIK